MFNKLQLLAVFCIGLLFVQCKSKINENVSPSEKPNILIIHVDDLGYNDLSGNGSQIYQTPNIDKLASQSVVFNNAYANYPRCVPSRYAMMTGKYPIQNGDVPDDGFELSTISDDKNFIKQLNKANYKTAYFGKWHLGKNDHSPKGFGYDFSFAAGAAGSPISFIYPFNTPKGNNKNVKKTPIVDIEEISKKGDYLTDNLTNAVIKYISEADKSQPFMAMLSFYAVHQPLEAKEEDIQRNQQEINTFNFGNQPEYINEGTGRTKMRQDNAIYAAMVENMDVNIGRLLATLDQLGITDNTIVVFSSDHGGLSNDGYNKRALATSNYPLRAGKGWFYEGGIKVPLTIKWNKKFIPKQEKESIVLLMDVFPTLIDIVGSKKIADVDGKSVLPLIEGIENWKDRTVFWHSSKARPRNTGENNSSAIRSGDWKLVHFYEENKIELYNVKKDISEATDLSVELPEKTSELMNLLNTWKNNF